MSCTDCTAAAADPHWHGYRAGCLDCAARAISLGPEHFRAQTAGRMTADYKRVMTHAFGDAWLDWHPKVKRWAEERAKAPDVIEAED